jgi:hypothetical protein
MKTQNHISTKPSTPTLGSEWQCSYATLRNANNGFIDSGSGSCEGWDD